MTKTWPGKPGVPINADRDGWHWLKTGHGVAPWLWRDDPQALTWGMGWETNEEVFAPGDIARVPGTIYLGPVLTPDETAALQKRCEEAERERDALRRDTSQEIATDKLVRRLQHLGDWQAADRIEALQKRVAELEGALATARLVPPLNPDRWRGAINDALTNWLDTIRDEDVPKDALRRLVAYEVTAALDPAVSQAAADLVATARLEGMEEAAKIADSCGADWAKSAKGKFVETKWDYESRADAADEIAAAIRAAAKEGK